MGRNKSKSAGNESPKIREEKTARFESLRDKVGKQIKTRLTSQKISEEKS